MSKQTPEIRPIRKQDLVDFYGQNLPHHTRGWAIEYDGQVAALAGITIHPKIMLVWCTIKPDVRASRRTVYETGRRIMEKIDELNYPVVYAIANPELDTAISFLVHLGWKFCKNTHQGVMFKWQIRQQHH